ncbi:MAG: hypothetical protein HC922_03925 [Leptolyngbyaceae cyanobacterium SM2_3_12]|nr:hypothetical protein [Leptolyngbyaceae cyanobacterium SM2_3_12]
MAIAQDLQYIRHQVSAIQRQTAVDRAGYRQGKARLRAELWPPLLGYVEELQAQVQMALATMGEARQQLALVQQEQRQSDRQALAASVEAMFVQLAAFRQDLRTQRAQITTLVWGTEPVPTPGVSPQAAQTPSTVGQKPAAAPKPIAAKPGIAPKVAVAQPKGVPQPAAKPIVAAKPAAVVKPVTSVTPLVPVSPLDAPVVVEPPIAEVKSAQTPDSFPGRGGLQLPAPGPGSQAQRDRGRAWH